MNEKKIIPFCAALLGSFAIAAPRAAQAWYDRHHASECQVLRTYGGDAPDIRVDSYGALERYGGNSNDAAFLFCTVEDRDDRNKDSVASLNVHVYDGNDDPYSSAERVCATACNTYYGSTGGYCDSDYCNSWNSTGHTTLQLTSTYLDPWDDFYHFGYFRVHLPPEQLGSRSNFRGFYVSN